MSHAATLDQIFRETLARSPNQLALVDPANRDIFTGGMPRTLTYKQTDDAISAVAARLRGFGLHVGTVVALQLPCTVESVVTLLGVQRTGMIPAPLPMLWREMEIAKALTLAGAKVIFTTKRIGASDHCTIAMQAAAQAFQVRYVCAFSEALPDGVVPLDDIFTEAACPPPLTDEKSTSRPALITFELAADGVTPIVRNQAEVLAGAAFLNGRPAKTLLTTVPLASFAGIALAVVPWLRSGGTLLLHQPFDPNVFAAARSAHHCDSVVLPGPMLAAIQSAGLLKEDINTVTALWRSRAQLGAAEAWRGGADLFDVLAVGESDLAAGPRSKAQTEDSYSAAWLHRR